MRSGGELEVAAILRRCEAGAASPAVALMDMLIATEDHEAVRALLARASTASEAARAIAALFAANEAGCARVASMLQSGVDSPPENATVDAGIAFCRKLFDWSVRQSEEASVALYSLGNPEILRVATREIVTVLAAWGVLHSSARVLDVGCGIGRMEEALAPRVAEIHGIDVSEEMVDVARRRCGAFANVRIDACSGRDLGAFADGSFDLVLAVDSMPYLVQSGLPLVATHFAEARRVLRARGELVILNFSYREDAPRDIEDVRRFAQETGFDVLVAGERPFALWNGAAFRMRARNP